MYNVCNCTVIFLGCKPTIRAVHCRGPGKTKARYSSIFFLHMWIRIYDQTHSQKFFVGRSNGGAEQRQPVNHRCPERRCNKQLKYVGPIQKIEAAAISINFSNDHPKCCFMEWSLLIWLTAPFHSPTAVPWGSKVAEKDSHHLVPPRDTWCLWEETPYRVKMGLAPALLPFWSLLWHTLCPTFRSTCHHPSSFFKKII